MPTFTGKTFSNFYKNLFGINQTSNTGIDSTTRAVQDGAGNNTSISLSDDVLSVQPVNDDTTGAMLVKNKGGDNILAVNTTDSKVLVGASQVTANTQYASFGVSSSQGLSVVAGTHYLIPFGNLFTAGAVIAFGTATNPLTSYDVSENDNGDEITMMLWYVPDNITVDAVHLLAGGSAASGDTINIHLLRFDIDKGYGGGKGDLSNGAVIAGGADIASLGYENIIYQTTSPSSADVDAGQVITATFESNGTNSDYAINMTVKYHVR